MISAAAVSKLRRALQNISSIANTELAVLWRSFQGMTDDELRDFLLLSVPTLTDKYGNMAAVVAAEFYEEIRVSQIGGNYQAVLAGTVPIEKVEASVRYAARHIYDGNALLALEYLQGIIDVNVKQPARDTIFNNARRDPARPKFARVPTGSETCAWCMMLASRGFVYANAKTAGELGQYHKNCDCQAVAEFSSHPEVEGYDPEGLYDIYQAARRSAASSSEEDILAEMRRLYPDTLTDGVQPD